MPPAEAPPVAAPAFRGRAVARLRAPGAVALLAALLPVAVLVSLGVGALPIAPAQSLAILADRLAGIDLGVAYDARQEAVMWSIRLPRVLLGVLVGAALGVAGAALQGVFRNPLADPGIVGVSSGASLGASVAIVGGVGALGSLTLPALAFAGALGAALLVYAVARRGGRTEVVTLVLTGLAVVAVVESAVGLLTSLADDDQLRDLTFWRLGSLGGATWDAVAMAAPLVLATVLLTPFLARPLDLLSLGEREAGHLGVDTERVRVAAIALAALGVGAAVAVAGTVVFVGLVVPHMVRLLAGPRHATLLPASAVGGALLLVLADVVARTAAAPVELPLGVVTGLVGGPFFLWLLHRTRRAQGGWA